MVKVNIFGKEYVIDLFDTRGTLINRIAFKEQTLPQYIKVVELDFVDEVFTFEKMDSVLRDLPFSNLVDTVNKLEKEYNVRKTTIAKEYLRIHFGDDATQETISSNEKTNIALYFKRIDEKEFPTVGVIFRSYDSYIKTYKAKRKQLRSNINKETMIQKRFKKYTPMPYTEFIQDSIVKQYILEIDLDPLDLFNQLHLKSPLVFCQLQYNNQQYFKTLNKIKIEEDWIQSLSNNQMQIKIQNMEMSNEYYTASIKYDPNQRLDDTHNRLIMTIEYSKNENSSKTEQLLLNAFENVKFNIVSSQNIGIRGIFGFPNLGLAKGVFLDLLTNNDMVGYYFYTDESRSISIRKTSLYIYYSPESTENKVMTAYLSEREANRKDPLFKNNLLQIYTPYMNVRISRAMNTKQVSRFQKVLGTILRIYVDNYSKIVSKYSSFLPNFSKDNPNPVIQREKTEMGLKILQEKDAKLFIQGYPTKCEKKKQPVPIDEKDLPENAKPNKYMEYPKNSGNYYYCPHDDFPYPGLLKNKLDNKDEYPYLPCCYPQNQLVEKKLYNLYYQGKDKQPQEEQDKITNINLVKLKAIKEGKRGLLPRNLYYCIGKNYYRTGTPFTPNSLLHAILQTMDMQYLKLKSTDKKEDYAKDVRRNLANSADANYAQSMFNYSHNKLTNLLLDNDQVLDSKYFTELLENYFNVHIYVFTRTDDEPNGDIEIPFYSQGYLKKRWKKTTPVIFLYKHKGIRSDYLKEPHYETILYENPETKMTKMKFVMEDIVSKRVMKYFNRVYQLSIAEIGNYIPPLLNKNFTIISQKIDIYGKCRGIEFQYKDNVYNLLFSPIAPLPNIPIKNDLNIQNSMKETKKLIEAFNFTIQSQDINSLGQAVGFSIEPLQYFHYMYIPFQENNIDTSIPTEKLVGYYTNDKNNAVQMSQRNKKIAEYLIQYCLYYFSRFIKNQLDYSTMNENDLQKFILQKHQVLHDLADTFIKQYVIIKSDHVYNLQTLPRKLSLNTNFFIDKKLVVDTNETYERLRYYLHYMLNKNKKYVLNYQNKVYLDNFYIYFTDFQQFDNQQVFIGTVSLKNWIVSNKDGVDLEALDHFLPENKDPYFMYHWKIHSGRPVLIQNVLNGDKARALGVLHNFNKHGMNTGYFTTPIVEKISYTVLYMSHNELEMRQFGDNPIGSLIQYAPNNYGAILYL